MLQFFRAGGFPMWVVLALGGAALASAFAMLRAPDPRRLGAARAFSWATAFAAAGGTATDLISVFHYMANEADADAHALYQGLAEALSPLVLGATILSVVWLVVAVAVRRARDVSST
jgi:biopolymer transport protein ExbB/TolQ